MMQMVGAFAEFERAMLKERTKAGLDSAREEGRIGGRRPKLSPQQQAEIQKMVSKGDKTAADAARLFKIHPATVCRLLARPASTSGALLTADGGDDRVPGRGPAVEHACNQRRADVARADHGDAAGERFHGFRERHEPIL